MLHIDALGHRYGSADSAPILDDLTFTVADDEFVCLLGPSGCGKSTLLKIIAGLITPATGSLDVDGRPVLGQTGHAAYMPQQDELLPWRRAIDNAALAADIHGIAPEESRARARAAFQRFGLAGYEAAWPDELSGGMRQRLALLRTYLADRSLLLLDEPFGALDAITRRSMQVWLQEVWSDDPRAVLLVTHDVDEAILLADRVLVMSPGPGRIVADVPIDAPRPRAPSSVTEPWFLAHKVALLDHLVSAMPDEPGGLR